MKNQPQSVVPPEEIAEGTKDSTTKTISAGKILVKTTLIALLLVTLFLFITGVVGGLIGYGKFKKFAQAAGVSEPQFINTIKTGWSIQPESTDDHINLLLLGVDSLKTRGDAPAMTDSMMLVSVNTKTGKISTLSLPRDLWSHEYQTKINALYVYGLDRYPEHPEQFPTEVVASMTGIPIHHTVVLSIDEVAHLIDAVGGITIQVPVGFTDNQFPRTDVDVTTETDPVKLYKTIQFDSGETLMDGEMALSYMRSRHGDNDQNTDQSRSERQQLVIQALLQQLTDKKYLTNPQLMGQLYRFYLDNFSQYLSPEEAVAITKQLFKVRSHITLYHQPLPITSEAQEGVISHPPIYEYDGQWVYVINNPQTFQSYVKDALY